MATKILSPISFQTQFRSVHQQSRESTLDRNQIFTNLLKIHYKMRESSIHFMLKACSKYRFRKDTLFLAIKLMDTLIEKRFTPLAMEAQLVSACLILIATKFNEVYSVTIDQLTLVMERYSEKEAFLRIEGQILEFIDFKIPEYTVFSQLYNQLEPAINEEKCTDSDKQNDQNQQNNDLTESKPVFVFDEKKLTQKTLKVLRQPECYKYGESFLFHALLNHIKNIKSKGISESIFKINYLKTVLKKLFEPQTETRILSDSRKAQSKLMPPKSPKLNPEVKVERKLKFLIF